MPELSWWAWLVIGFTTFWSVVVTVVLVFVGKKVMEALEGFWRGF